MRPVRGDDELTRESSIVFGFLPCPNSEQRFYLRQSKRTEIPACGAEPAPWRNVLARTWVVIILHITWNVLNLDIREQKRNRIGSTASTLQESKHH